MGDDSEPTREPPFWVVKAVDLVIAIAAGIISAGVAHYLTR